MKNKVRNHNETAESHMVTQVSTASANETVSQVLRRFYAKKPYYETLDYTYILNGAGKLKGIVSTKELVNASPKATLGRLMKTKFVTVSSSTDQERVAMTAIRHGIKAVPVVTKDRRLLGVVPPRVIFKILHWEHTEDMLRLSGLQGKGSQLQSAIRAGAIKMSFLRMPSLIIGILGGLIATMVVQHFEVSLRSQLVLAFFIPIVLYLSAAVGGQTGTILIRTLATETIKIKAYVLRELYIGMVIALIVGGLMFSIVLWWYNSLLVAFTIGLSLVLSITTATLLGILIPWGLSRMNKDPAISGGPLINVVQDIISLVIYFSVASTILF